MRGSGSELVLVFDLGRVLIDFDPQIIIDRLSPYTHWSKQDMFSLFATPEFVDAFEKGKMEEDEFFDMLGKILSLEGLDRGALREIWNDMFFPKKEMLSLIRRIKESTDIRLLMLSNISKIHFEYLFSEYEELSLFDDYVLSFQVGHRKPERQIYRCVLEKAAGARAICYTDDVERFVYAAREVGIDGIHFKGYDYYLSELLKRPMFREVLSGIIGLGVG